MKPLSRDTLNLAAFLALVALIASNLVSVRYTNRELEPFWNSSARFTLAAFLFASLMMFTGERMPSGRALAGALLYGAFAIAIYFALVYWGLVEVKVGYAQAILSLAPLMTVLLAVIQRLERLRAAALAGAGLAVAGVAIVFADQVSADVSLWAGLAIVGAAACAAEAGIIMKLLPPPSLIATNTVAMTVGAVTLLAISFASGEPRDLPDHGTTWFAFMYLSTVGTVGTFLLSLYVLRHWTASAASYQFVLAPVVSVLLAWLLLDESVSWGFVAGAALVVAGAYVGAIRPQQAASSGRVDEPARGVASETAQ